MIETFRWFGVSDPITLDDIIITGAEGVVTALHDVLIGEIWPIDKLKDTKKLIENKGLKWNVVESIPVHESIKYGGEERDKYIDNYIKSIKNISKVGINVLCYNFMPVVDWTRTNLMFEYSDNCYSLRFDIIDFIIFDIFILERDFSEDDYDFEQVILATFRYNNMSIEQINVLKTNILQGLPGSMVESYNLESFREKLKKYTNLTKENLQNNLKYFLERIIPVAEEYNVYLAIHPDDPPINLFGIPRIVSKFEDLEMICNCYPSENNGLTLCVGSLGSINNNDVNMITEKLSSKVHFVHLRNVIKDKHTIMLNSFTESSHLSGDIDMAYVVNKMLSEKRSFNISFRPDHGHLILDDIKKQNINPGYSLIGRLKGLAELRGLIYGLRYNKI